MFDMCRGEVREIDIPSLLGYGRSGSEYSDIPGDVRLWWRLELVALTNLATHKKFTTLQYNTSFDSPSTEERI
jgi:hypothetical protein